MALAACQIIVGLVVGSLFLNVTTSNAQTGFISIDCGATKPYQDGHSIDWVPDTGYILTGVNSGNVTVGVYTDPTHKTLRYFPEGRNKYCYVLNATLNDTYLIRSSFLYGMYDGGPGGNRYPEFDLTIDANLIGGVYPNATNTLSVYETIVVAVSSNIYVCLEPHSPLDVPFINSLELRSLGSAALYYPVVYQGYYLNNRNRWNFGYDYLTRYHQDTFDRKWYGYGTTGASVLNTSHVVDTSNPLLSMDLAPTAVLQTAQTWPLTQNFTYSFNIPEAGNYMVWLWWAEIDPQASNERRSMLAYFDTIAGDPVNIVNITGGMYIACEYGYRNISLTLSSTMTLAPAPDSQLGVMLNAMEVYRLSGPLVSRTYPSDAMAIESIKTSLNLVDWTGDPCLHHHYDWITCTSDTVPRVSALNLANYNLTGPIPASIANLTALNILYLENNALYGTIPDLSALTGLQQLHLQDNLLSGPFPEWVSSLTGLSELLVQNNNLSGPIPDSLKGKSNFTFQYSPGNTFLCVANTSGCNALPPSSTALGPSPNKNSSTIIPIVVGCVVGGLVLIAGIGLLLCFFVCRRKKGVDPQPGVGALPIYDKETNGVGSASLANALRPQGTGIQTKPYTLAEVKAATDNFSTQIGEGGFGPVYKGILPNGQEVAVKRCSPSNRHGVTEFLNEVDLLSRVHHRNLVSLVGYCHEGQDQILIYEYMPMGNLREHVHADALNSKTPLSWNQRLHIALDSAQGLEYLHNGCSPSIIHRDVKTTNILLSDKMMAKVADFGISKLTNSEIIIPHSTDVKGTAGYLDPEYLTTRRLKDKSDVYSFGVVLLELISGRPAIDKTRFDSDQAILIAWVRPRLEAANLRDVVDPVLGNNYNVESMWKVAETAMLCVEPSGVNRPTMTYVMQELREAIAMEERPAERPAYNDYSVASAVSDPNIPNSGLVVARSGRSFGTGFDVSDTYSDGSQGHVGLPMPR